MDQILIVLLKLASI